MRNSWTLRGLLALLLAGAAPIGAQRATSSDVDAIMARATTLRRLNRKADALAAMDRAVLLAPERADVMTFRALLAHEVNGSEASLGVSHAAWDDGREPWSEPRLELRRNTSRGPAIVRLSHVDRFGLRDDKVELEAYPAFRAGYVSLGASYASNGALYARSTLAAEVFVALPKQLEGSLGCRRLNFANAVNVATASLGKYYRDFLFGGRASHATGGARGTSTILSARRYFGAGGTFVGGQASGGSMREEIRTTTDIETLASRSVGGEGQFVIESRWVVSTRASLGREQRSGEGSVVVGAVSLGVGVRF